MRVILVLTHFRRTFTAGGWACACGTECAAEYALFLRPETAAVTSAVLGTAAVTGTIAVTVTVTVTVSVTVTVKVMGAVTETVTVTLAGAEAGGVAVATRVTVSAAALTWKST